MLISSLKILVHLQNESQLVCQVRKLFHYIRDSLMRNLCEIFQILQIQKRLLSAECICGNTVITILSQRSNLEFVSWLQKAGSSPQNLWRILCDIGASEVAAQLRQFQNVQISLCTTGFLSTTPLTYYNLYYLASTKLLSFL